MTTGQQQGLDPAAYSMPLRRTCHCASKWCAHHQAVRAGLTPIVQSGNGKCWRCQHPIPPDAPWDLGHDDNDINIWRGIECVQCNRSTATRQAERRREAKVKRWTL